ncbi:MAG: alanine--tRNA ligase [Patescibacteria group bacterium]
MLSSSEVRKKYIDFFVSRQHSALASGPLTPENDPTTLFTGSGMQVLLPYLLGEPHPEGRRLTDSQKCFRTEDIEEVGDNRHTTFFEMLGNWSLGEYFKTEQLPWCFEFFTSELGIDPARLYVSVFAGDTANNIPRDEEAVRIWKGLFAGVGIDAKDVELLTPERGNEIGMQDGRIFYFDASKNWWSRAGRPEAMPVGEPGGPDSEIFYEFTEIPHDTTYGAFCHPNCDCGRFMEIGNSVFMEYRKTETGFEPLPQRNVDYGGGLERATAAANNNPDVFTAVDSLAEIVQAVEVRSQVDYRTATLNVRWSFRVIADHLRAATFLISDGAEPSNKERGYVVRRLLRRAVRHMDLLGMKENSLASLVGVITASYKEAYPEVLARTSQIAEIIGAEEQKFRLTLARGERELAKIVEQHKASSDSITGQDIFMMYATYGFPVELSLEELERVILPALSIDERRMYDRSRIMTEFAIEFEQHQALSRVDVTKKFHGGLADDSWECTRLHTATHLLQETLRRIVGAHVFQKGSNITRDRLRFDFSHDTKLTPEQLQAVEKAVNEAISLDLPVSWREMTFAEAQAVNALGLFESRYGEKVKVYEMGDYSKEVCGGPHVTHTAQVGTFVITKEEAVSRGIRRIRAVVR